MIKRTFDELKIGMNIVATELGVETYIEVALITEKTDTDIYVKIVASEDRDDLGLNFDCQKPKPEDPVMFFELTEPHDWDILELLYGPIYR